MFWLLYRPRGCRGGRRGHDGISSLSVVGEVGLVAESSLEEAVGGCSLSRASNLASPEAVELGCLDGVAGHWDFEELGA